MEDLSRLCLSCMGIKDENGICPRCKTDIPPQQEAPYLPLQVILNERYYIGKAIKKNGEGITYLAFDLKTNRTACVREFFPDSIAQRDFDGVTVLPSGGSEYTFNDYLSDFNELWSKLIRLKGLTAMISAYDLFGANGTAYAVYSDSESLNLRDYLLQTPTGYIPWEQARILFMPVLSTLGTLHTSGIIHRGISPSSFIFTEDGKLKLTDFSIAAIRSTYADLEPEIRDGFAPIELYTESFPTGAWTDVYSFTAVLYRTLVGTMPITAPVRAQNDQMMIPAKFAEQLPPYVINALINGMQIEPEDRTRNIEQLRSNLSASPRAVSASAPVYSKPPVNRPQQVRTPAAQPSAQSSAVQQPAAQPAPSPNNSRYENYTERAQAANELVKQAEQKNRKNKLLTTVLCLVLVLLIVGIGLIVSAIFSMQQPSAPTQETTTAQATVIRTVPSFVGQRYTDITAQQMYTLSFHLVKVEQPSSTVEAGVVISQSVAPQTSVKEGSDIILYVSTGPEEITVPDVTGMTYEAAVQILAAKGLLCSKATKYNDGTHTPDTVAETFPLVGTPIKAGDSISIILWSNPTPATEAPAETTQPEETTAPLTQPTDTYNQEPLG
ncbi:MAG: PASTA domain-containing protein [Clostridia bacterium]|nr:PASTA domain-containing protein [Clostridia bacterium]MBR3974957.1 PASTA domain-containing protein [Clostridia bacterium]